MDMSILYWDPHERVCSTLLVCAYLAITCWYGQCRQLLNGLSGSSRWWGWIWVAFCRRDFVLPWREASGRNWVSQDEHKKSGGKNKINISFPPYKDINLLVIGKVIYPSGVHCAGSEMDSTGSACALVSLSYKYQKNNKITNMW